MLPFRMNILDTVEMGWKSQLMEYGQRAVSDESSNTNHQLS